MAKSVLGTLLITMGIAATVAACGDSNGNVGTAAVPTPQETTPPTATVTASPVATATIETPTGNEEPTVSAAIEAQLARGWPTPEGLPTATPQPTKSPVDKSDWTVLNPSPCVPGRATTVGEFSDLERDMYAFIDISRAKDDAELVNMADIIIHGIPVGDIEATPPTDFFGMTIYYQDVEVVTVLRGQVPADTIRVLQVGFDWPVRPENLEKYQIDLGSGFDQSYPGPLNQCPQILFLIDSSPTPFLSVGEIQGVFQLGPDERLFYAQNFESFLGLDVAQVKSRIESLAQP